MKDIDHVSLASLIGRYYAMDRDNRWERTEKAYSLLVEGEGTLSKEPEKKIQDFYEKEITDEFMEPILCNSSGLLERGDGVLFFNFRADRARQLTQVLTQSEFSEFKRNKIRLYFIALTEYNATLNLPVLFPPNKLKNIFGRGGINKSAQAT